MEPVPKELELRRAERRRRAARVSASMLSAGPIVIVGTTEEAVRRSAQEIADAALKAAGET